MIDYEGLRKPTCKGLTEYVGCPVVRSNQTEPPPKGDYISYTITILIGENKGTYGEYEDGKDRKPVTQTWSITAISKDNLRSVTLANKAREWLDHYGTVYLNDNNVFVQSVGAITNRDNILTVDYEYRNGFDVVFNLFDVVDNPIAESGYIETVNINGEMVEPKPTIEELNEQLEKRLTGG